MKFCGNCGNELLDNFTFCPRCGRQIADNAAPYQSDAQSQYQQAPQYRPTDYDDIFGENYPPQSTGIKAMIFGILSIWISFIPGIIFACIARKTAKEVFDAIEGLLVK